MQKDHRNEPIQNEMSHDEMNAWVDRIYSAIPAEFQIQHYQITEMVWEELEESRRHYRRERWRLTPRALRIIRASTIHEILGWLEAPAIDVVTPAKIAGYRRAALFFLSLPSIIIQ